MSTISESQGTGSRGSSFPESDIIEAYNHCRRRATIIGISLCMPIIVFSLYLRNLKLEKGHGFVGEGSPEEDSVRGEPSDIEKAST